jgi:hypothetical protein
MKGRNLVLLAVVFAILAGLALLTSKRKQQPLPDQIGRPVFPDLAVNDIARIAVQSAQGRTAVARSKEVWVVPERYNYPADFARVKEWLMKLADLKVGQVVRADDRQRAELKLLPPAKAAGGTNAATVVELFAEGDRKLASLLVGASHSRKAAGQAAAFGEGGGYPDGSYVSPDGGQSVYLVGELLDGIPSGAKEWMEPELLSVQAADVARVSVTGPDRPELTLARNEASNQLELPGLSPKEEMDTSKLYGIESALSYLRFEDVADPTRTDEQLGMDSPTLFTLETKKGEVYTVKIGGVDPQTSNRYVNLSVTLKEPAAQPAPGTGTVNEAAEKAKATEREELKKKVRDVNARVSAWTYLLAAYKTDSMTVARAALVKPKEEKKEEPKQPGTEPQATNATPAAAAAAPQATNSPAPAAADTPAPEAKAPAGGDTKPAAELPK